jgi:hypothetical protein
MTKPIEYQKQNKAPTDAAYQYNDSRIIEANTRRRHESQYAPAIRFAAVNVQQRFSNASGQISARQCPALLPQLS